MFKKIFLVLSAGVLLFGLSQLTFAQSEKAEAVTQVTTKEAVNVGNKICPVSGEKIDEKMKAIYEYEGKIYNFCCAACVEEFKKDPQKYIKKVEEELKAATPEHKTSRTLHKEHQHSH